MQSGTPLQILSAPANDFVLDFFGRGDVGIKLLGLQRVGDHLRANVQDLPDDAGSGEAILATLSLREALSIFVSRRVSRLSVIDSQGQHMGSIELQDLLGPTGPATRHPPDNP